MKTVEKIEHSFQASVADSIRLLPEGVDRFQVFTPFHFDDGDHFVVVLLRDETGNWALTDEGHTYMHMSYRMDLASLEKGSRNEIIEGSLEKYGVKEREGQIFTQIDELTNAGNTLYNFIQCLIRITDVSYLSRERVASTFMEDFRRFISGSVPEERLQFDYRDTSKDPDGKYQVDCRINSMERPLHIYAVGNDDKCRDVTISILQHQKWRLDFFAMGVFEDQEQISRKVLSRFTDVCDRQFSSLSANRERIHDFLKSR